MTEILTRSAELRSEVTGNTLTGYGQVWGTYADLTRYVETFAPNAFDASLADPASDVRSFWNHQSGLLLGRQSAGTLRVWTDSTGLGFEVSLPRTSAGNDVRELAERGDIGGVSVGFRPGTESWSTLGGRELRTHDTVTLIEISPCSIPAYGDTDTTVQLRSLADIPTHRADQRTQILAAKTRVNRKVNL